MSDSVWGILAGGLLQYWFEATGFRRMHRDRLARRFLAGASAVESAEFFRARQYFLEHAA